MQHEENNINQKEVEENNLELNEESNLETVDENNTEVSNKQVENNNTTDELEKLKVELAESKDKYLRLFAEFDNFKKRSAKEKRELSLVAGQDIMKDLLPILDDIKRANNNYTKDSNTENFAQGVQLILEKFIKTLQQKGLKEMESIGYDFDVEKHEAIAEIPAPNDEQKGKIIDEVEAGYLLNGTIIRYAKVVVGK